jgi:prephenate dehydrogenase
MRLFKQVAVVGVGLIGGSLALALKKRRLAKKIVGVSRHKESILFAQKMGVIDRGALDLGIIQGSDLLVLATPVDTIFRMADAASSLVGEDCVVFDVGSTKQKLVAHLERLFPRFVGCHPLAGSEKRGVAFARADLFRHSCCIVTPTPRTHRSSLRLVKQLWEIVGARVGFLSPAEHDKVLSYVSHLPHVVAYALMQVIPAGYIRFAAGGLKDTTRIAGSESELWCDILMNNRTNLLKVIDAFKKQVHEIETAIKKNDKVCLERIFTHAKKKREKFLLSITDPSPRL